MMARMCDPTLSVRLGVFVGSLGTWLGLQLVFVGWLWNLLAWESAKKGV